MSGPPPIPFGENARARRERQQREFDNIEKWTATLTNSSQPELRKATYPGCVPPPPSPDLRTPYTRHLAAESMHKHFCNNALPVDFATPHTPNFLLAHTVGLTLEEMQKAHEYPEGVC